jgi:homoserine dehydrogenase
MGEVSLAALLPPLRILLLGYGNVAQAFLPLLAARSEWLGRELGIRPLISGIGTQHQGFFVHATGIAATTLAEAADPLLLFRSQSQQVQDAATFIQKGRAAQATVLIELTSLNPQDGQPALSLIRLALQSGLHVITANKGPVAYGQAELEALARRHGVQFRFESTVMDGLPLINLAQFTLQAVQIISFRALLNTTSTLVLSMMEQGYSLDDAIRKAQQLGIAETDPWYDLDGWDAALKTTILVNNLLEGRITPAMVQREGIRNLPPADIFAAALAGASIRLVSRASRKQGVVSAQVGPERIESNDVLYVSKEVAGIPSIIVLETEAMGTITLIEHESLVRQTAYGVLSDLIAIVRQRSAR